MADAWIRAVLVAIRDVASKHAEALYICKKTEYGELGIMTHGFHGCGILVHVTKGAHVVYGQTPILLEKSFVQAPISHLWNFSICTILRRFEVDRASPVV